MLMLVLAGCGGGGTRPAGAERAQFCDFPLMTSTIECTDGLVPVLPWTWKRPPALIRWHETVSVVWRVGKVFPQAPGYRGL
jgi:hypothetical protein